jgi:hypothetical protein
MALTLALGLGAVKHSLRSCKVAAKRRKTIIFEGLNQWLARPKYFGISGPFCSPTGSNPVGDAKFTECLVVFVAFAWSPAIA